MGYRSCLRRLFTEKTPFGAAYKGLAWLFLGVANSDALLYDDEWQTMLKEYPDNFKLDYALSREQKNKDGLKGMMPGILDMLEGVSKEKGVEWESKLKEWKKA